MYWINTYLGGPGNGLLVAAGILLAITLAVRGVILNRNNQRHGMLGACLALALGFIALGLAKGSIDTLGAIDRMMNGTAEQCRLIRAFLSPVSAFSVVALMFCVAACVVAVTRPK